MGAAHSHGLVDASIRRSRTGLRAVTLSLAVLGLTAAGQAVVLVVTGSVALLADLIHNAGDALTVLPLALAGAVGFAGNRVAAVVRERAGRRTGSAALIADGAHARADAWVSLG